MQSNRIKIFFFIDSFRIGGMHKQILYLVRHLDRKIFEPIVCSQSQHGGLCNEFKNTGAKLIDLKWQGRGSFAILYRLIKALRYEQPDIIYITQAPNLVYYRMARVFINKQIVQVGSLRALSFWLGHKNKYFQYLDNWLAKWLYHSSDHIITNSIVLKEHYSQKIKINESKTIKVIYNGSDFNFPISKQSIEMRRELGIDLQKIVIVMVARLDPWKDFDTLLETAKIVIQADKRALFLIVGEGELRGSIEDMIMRLGIGNNVLLLGEKIDVFNYLNLADLSILSTNGEGFSNSILESMALGKPVIATDVGGNAELIGSSCKYGMLIPIKSPMKFSDAIIYLMKNDDIRVDIGQSAKEHIRKLCSIDNYITLYEKFFLLANGKHEIV